MIMQTIEKYVLIVLVVGGIVFAGGMKYRQKVAKIAELEQTIAEYEKQAELAKNAQEQLKAVLLEKQKQKDKVITKIVTQIKEVPTSPECDKESSVVFDQIRGQVNEFNSK